MANVPLKSIKFPGLSDTYTVPQIDNTLTTAGKAADAKKTGDELTDLKSAINYIRKGERTFDGGNILQGVYYSDGSYHSDETTRICTPKISVTKGEVIDVTPGVVCAKTNCAYINTEGVYSALGWSADTRHLTVPYDGYFVCILCKSTTTDTISPSDYDATIKFTTQTASDIEQLFAEINYIEPKYTTGYYIQNDGSVQGNGTGNRLMSEHIPCSAGIVVHYMAETNHTLISALTFYSLDDEVLATHVNEGAVDTEYTATAPANTAYCILSSKETNKTGIWFSSSPIFETLLKAQEDIKELGLEIIPTERIEDGAVTPVKTSFFAMTSHNLINPANIRAALYWSPSGSAISTGSELTGNMLSGLIEVEPGETYTFSGTAGTNMGGYFPENATCVSGQSGTPITFFEPVTGSGYCFTVPESGVKYVALNISKNTSTQEPSGTYQLELGEMATPVVPYNPVWKIEEQYLPEGGQTVTSGIDSLPTVSYDSTEKTKLTNFFEHCRKKDKDIVVIGTGTSLTARSSEHCTTRTDATSRPPLMHSNNFASKMWDIMRWEGQQYRRFDYSGFFTETGTWATTHNLSDWDDKDYRYGITRYASGSASVKFTIPKNAWQFNFIYRSDASGSEAVSVAVAEGNGKVEVFNGTEWVEANGYSFSMKQTVATLSNITVKDPNTVGNTGVSVESYQVGGNTTYQKRLKMRCKASGGIDSLASTKDVTVSSSSGRLLYWGVEWSPREFMITYINAARGSHNMTYSSELSLSHYQDNEIWDFKPDVIFTEIPIHNSGAAGTATNLYYTTYWGYATDDFFFNTDNPISFVSRATAKGINVSDLEWVLFTSSLSYNFDGIDDDGELIIYMDKSGKAMSALDAQTLTYEWLKENKNSVVAINACKYWCDAGVQLFGDMKTATLGSGKDGYTFTNEGSHWNDTGSAVIAKCVGGSLRDYD